MKKYFRLLRPLIPLAVLTVALWLLFREVRHYHYRDVVSYVCSYNFGVLLRQFKNQFDPVWRPKYLASRGGLALPVVLANVAALINR